MRLFLAAELPGKVRERVLEVRAELAERLRGWRWVRPEGVHLTLRFLGEVTPARDREARRAWRAAAASVSRFHLRVTNPGCFPERGSPRVLWLGVEETEPGSQLATLATSLEAAARAAGWKAETRRFHPHLTLARRGRGGPPDDPAGSWPGIREAGGWVEELVLFRSRLGSEGASYTALESFPLRG